MSSKSFWQKPYLSNVHILLCQYPSAFSVLNNNIQMRLCCWQWIGFIWPPHLANGRRAPTVFVRLCILYLYCFQLYLCIFVLVLFVMGTITILVSSQLPVMWQRAASNRSQSDETPRLRRAGFLLLIKTTHRHHHHNRSHVQRKFHNFLQLFNLAHFL